MRTRPFGPTGEDVPVVGQGTWAIHDATQAREAIRLGLDLGMTHVDTAEMYTGAEATLAPLLADRRDDVFLVSKVMPQNASYGGTLAACEGSLRRLGVDQLDVYLLHWPSRHPIEDTMRAMAELVDRGLTRHVGVSNFYGSALADARDALAVHGIPLACDQVPFHLGNRRIEDALLPWCRENDVAVVGYSPLGQGDFPPRGAGRDARRVLDEVAAAHGATPEQVALAFLLRQDVFLIPKAERSEHVRQNAAAAELELSEDEVERLDAAFPG